MRPGPTCWSWSARAGGRRSCGRPTRPSRRSRPTTRPARSATSASTARPGRCSTPATTTRPRPGTSRQALLAAESLGAVEVALEVSVQYAKERFTFGRAIGSYQAVKHDLVEILRRSENSRSLMYYTGWAGQDSPEEFPVAASAFRLAAGDALDHAGAPRSPSTAASARPGSTTRRCTSGARSCHAGCWAGPRTPPTAWPASCSPPRARSGAPPEAPETRSRLVISGSSTVRGV